MSLSPTPLIYCPVGIPRPACCPHRAPVSLLPGKGPDAVTTLVDGQEETTGGGGMIYGGSYDPLTRDGWRKTRAGWWVLLRNHKPQDLIRLQPHPRVRQWVTVQGARSDHQWQVPVLFDLSGGRIDSALDGIWDGEQWTAGELAPLQSQLLALINGVEQATPVDLSAALRDLAVQGLAVGHFVDLDLMVVGGWLSESLCLTTVNVMAGRGT